LHFLGVLRHQQGRTKEGIDLVRRALAVAPCYVDAWSNLGNLYKESSQLDEAEAAYRRSLELNSQHAAAWNNLGIVLRARGHPDEAAIALRRAIELAPASSDAHFNLGNALREARRFAEAIDAYRKALALDPDHARAHYRLGYLLYITGQPAQAAAVFGRWLQSDPQNPVAAHMLAACSGEHVPTRASDDYVRTTFDTFASSFDDVLLHRLNYDAPQRLLEALAPMLGPPEPVRDILDAGCGTGLCAALLKPYARTLTGVDLSRGMLARARARNAYDALHEEEITRFLEARAGAYDVIASADTLCYFGDLAALAKAARGALSAGGWFVFTVERDDVAETYRIQPHGRYCHAYAYVERVLSGTGFDSIGAMAANLRRELGADVAGWVFRARAPGA
jgi:predicted TPR repeat methyltransferase